MCKLPEMLLEALDTWKRTGYLPDGTYWQPGMDENNLHIEKGKIEGTLVSDFYETICPRLNISRKVANEVLKHLDRKGHIRLVWHSPHGAQFFLKK